MKSERKNKRGQWLYHNSPIQEVEILNGKMKFNGTKFKKN